MFDRQNREVDELVDDIECLSNHNACAEREKSLIWTISTPRRKPNLQKAKSVCVPETLESLGRNPLD